jgi:hypothetical protein
LGSATELGRSHFTEWPRRWLEQRCSRALVIGSVVSRSLGSRAHAPPCGCSIMKTRTTAPKGGEDGDLSCCARWIGRGTRTRKAAQLFVGRARRSKRSKGGKQAIAHPALATPPSVAISNPTFMPSTHQPKPPPRHARFMRARAGASYRGESPFSSSLNRRCRYLRFRRGIRSH